MSFRFVNVNEFTPDNGGWTSIGNISSVARSANTFTLTLEDNSALKVQISFLSAFTFRVRFNPQPNYDYNTESSVAVVNRDLGQVNLSLPESDTNHLLIDTGVIRILILLRPYQIKVFRGNQLIHQDMPSKNLIYIPGQEVVANFKEYPDNALYCGFGEKAGSSLLKNNYTMTFFNFDNYSYVSGIIPINTEGGPLNPAEPLYASIPLLLEINPNPINDHVGQAYNYGIFFDNPAQSYFNIGASDYSNMSGKFYFGALYGDMDYYFMYGDQVTEILGQYTTLTGRSSMPPKYVFGFHQGAYGYYNSSLLSVVANSYRASRIPIDGLHIDVDFQDNYRTFTSSKKKFPSIKAYMAYLHSIGFKCSTNITPLLTQNPLDENGEITPYVQREALMSMNGLIFDTRAGQPPNPQLYSGTVSYGMNLGSNPYPAPPLMPNNQGNVPLKATGNYPDFGREDVQDKWGDQYDHLINEVNIDMIWQDMTDPAIANPPYNTFPLDLQQKNGNAFVPHAKIHNLYALNLLKATTKGLLKLRPQKRTFIIARGGYAGMQRYAGLWTGDSASSWDFLKINLPQVLNLGLSGIPISGCDIGGFAVASGSSSGTTTGFSVSYGKVIGGITNYELFTRWMHLGAFLPWYRNHYNGYNKQFQEVYAYGEPVPSNCRKYIELRYRMVQIFYDAMYEWTQTGTPIARALFLSDGNDPNVYKHLDDQFFVGNNILIAPIVEQHETPPNPTVPVRDIYLPTGFQWYSFMDNKKALEPPVAGGTLVKGYYAGLDLVPVYIREGAILPMRELEQYIGELTENPLTFNIYPGRATSYKLYQDDGISTNAQTKQQYRITTISHQQTAQSKTVRIQRIFDQYSPSEKFFYIALLGTRAPNSVRIGNSNLPNAFDPEKLASSPVNSYYWNQNIQITFIKIFDNSVDISVTALF